MATKTKTTFYKYVNIESALIILATSTLKFTTPDKFNDPFDVYPFFPEKGFHKMFKRLFKENGHTDNFSLKKRKQAYNYSATPEFRAIISQRTAVTCFSKSAIILPMWAHYANNHEGCVLEFATTKEEAIAATLEMYNSSIYKDPDTLIPIEIQYSNTRPVAYDEHGQSQKMGLKAIFTKAAQWSYEEELRCIKTNESGIYPFPIHQLKRVIFGLKTSVEDKRKIRKLVSEINKKHNIFISITEIGMERFTFNLFIK